MNKLSLENRVRQFDVARDNVRGGEMRFGKCYTQVHDIEVMVLKKRGVYFQTAT